MEDVNASPTPRRWVVRALALMLGACGLVSAVPAHHSYAVFDMTRATSLEGRFAKMVWSNPHISLWVYVPKPGKKGEYDLWQFQSDSVNMAQRNGWTKDVLKADERVTLHFFPMRSKENGGYLIRLVRADGKELIGDANAPGVAKELAKTNSLPKQAVK